MKKPVKVKFEGISNTNEPIFKDIDSCLRYGTNEELFPYWTDEKTVLKKVTADMLLYYGDHFGCEPLGSRCFVEIVKR